MPFEDNDDMPRLIEDALILLAYTSLLLPMPGFEPIKSTIVFSVSERFNLSFNVPFKVPLLAL